MEKSERKPGEPLILRQKRVIKFEDLPLNVKKRLVENLNSINDYEDNDADDSDTENDVEEKTILKREIDIDQNEEREKRDEKKMKNLEIAKSELEKIEKNVENEILNLVKRSKKSKDVLLNNNSKRQVENPIGITSESQPRLLKIKVETVEFDQNTNDDNSQNNDSDKFKKNTLKKYDNAGRRQTYDMKNTNQNEKDIENKIKKRIEMIRDLVKRELEEKNKLKQIEINNAKFDELQESIGNNNPDYFDDKIIEKRNIKIEENNTRNKRKKIIKKSILIPERAQVKIEDKLSPDLEVDPRLSFSEANKYYRSSRDVGDNHGSIDVKNDQQINLNHADHRNFLFPGQSNNRQRRGMSSSNNKLSKNHGKFDKHKRQQKNQRHERAADEILNDNSADSVAESDGLVDASNSQDISPQLVPEYKEAFGGLPSDPNSDFFRYKRIKRDKYL
ncbi:hypothetical protein HCN44_010094 [Aphidius gifuensis]|uniref:Uncharacterized protein n=2 Tax=Aphidius gifuensis TaxID=684658 RepID=A0A835CS34_APHGI|nr:hypothetical protein HCN44_010094 [Aphidius gifuensis]